ncbi:hypothetical protein [Oricola cellulosilytica]|uniref:Uncharacterized protein n=1 Tax=Oricola cellulosilytica TaxID=1429082 RepID=A0A4R0P9I2_9HYPH|nr:hypothetical protein [Oricola cellulosilytica]TCD13821.1 hypothetical protein E0D97_12025 [Oricola cellulosilytica]
MTEIRVAAFQANRVLPIRNLAGRPTADHGEQGLGAALLSESETCPLAEGVRLTSNLLWSQR